MKEWVVLVDDEGNNTGVSEKLSAHLEGKLHRAFSIFIFNNKGELLLQKRAFNKYHSGGLLSNTCCSHPKPNEPLADAAHRRLREEMGFDCEITERFNFTYYIQLKHGLFENEYDHVFVGEFNGEPQPNHEEVSHWKWITPEALKDELKEQPDQYTYWLNIIIDKVLLVFKE